ncbi:MAG: GNAT family N-acetyltransferase [Deltaproteobacteria bacterium]|nr:GNAT family N-acetyltransferase [Deltaproteobacteria bacterium]
MSATTPIATPTKPDDAELANKVTLDSKYWPMLNLTNDATFVALRRKFYGERGLALKDETSSTLGEFAATDTQIAKLPVRLLHPLIGWESTGWMGCHDWSSTQWTKSLATLAQNGGWDIFQSLGQSPLEAAHVVSAAHALGLPYLAKTESVRVIHGFKSWEEFYKQTTSKFKQRYKSTMKAAEKNGFTLDSDVSYDEIRELFYRRNLKMSDVDNAKNERYQGFLQEWLAALKEQGRMTSVGVRVGGKLIAMALGFWREDVFFFHFTAYDPEYQQASPGSLAIYKLIEQTLNRGSTLYSFMGNFSYEKMYTPQTFDFQRVDVFPRTLKGRILYTLLKMKRK